MTAMTPVVWEHIAWEHCTRKQWTVVSDGPFALRAVLLLCRVVLCCAAQELGAAADALGHAYSAVRPEVQSAALVALCLWKVRLVINTCHEHD